ncbi:helicase-exonuclease AddAB, AddB subunit [Desulfosporosinus orientis DSM 765]|uniref:ATP-dependent helicase/deoxyribonuclease subunit B n=1 Tax=Desulfosporosinus orientis (strain ATCC 19365 / DSM 765 / NCIMB 8382 / VKM B-1628 / Singapore I) TaxID=768706 RepID=G7WDM4_DESOD|nr:helicase-exonuclease AddAB subunit AddB [Desulfosporosinus orientis]AET68349.1 helicase-exonuclease AddAB, AddB subunit [Desulfosporosinus orientis DSM 765]
MGFRFIFGRAGSGKSTLCLEEIRAELRKEPWGKPIIFLVPEQATYQMEVALSDTPDLDGSLRAQVLSFQRLGWRVFSETGGGQKVLIGKIGKQMLLRRILLKNRYELKVFARSATRPGMAELLAQTIGEFKTYRVAPETLRTIKSTSGMLTEKLEDLALLYGEFQASLGQEIRDPDDELSILAGKIPFAPLMRGAKVWVDGFNGFTPQELEVLKAIAITVEEVVITSCLDPIYVTEEFTSETGVFKAGEEFFTGPWKTFLELQRIALENNIPIHPSSLLKGGTRFKNPWLCHLETFFSAYPTMPFEKEELNFGGIQIISAVNQRVEVERVAQELRRLARDEGLCWNEMAVLSRDLSGYHELIAQLFTSYEVPHFIDYKRPVLHHPLIELLQSCLEIMRTQWSYEPLFRCLKTDFFPLSRDVIDRLENYVLEYGIRGEAWSRSITCHRQWSLGQDEEQQAIELKLQAELNAARQTIYDVLTPLSQGIVVDCQEEEQGLKVRTITESLYTFLETLNVPGTLEIWAQKAKEEGDLSEARLHEQIWESTIQVLDEIVAGLGEEKVELEDYALILASGMEGIELGLIPPGLDQVLVGSLDRSRNPEVKVLFLLGANEGVLPARPVSDGILDVEERKQLEEAGISLAPKGKDQTYEEQFYIYTALTRAKETLVVSYSLTDDEGKGLTVSPVVTRLKHLFPSLAENFLSIQEDIEKISQPDSALLFYAEQLRKVRQGEPLSPLWTATEKWLLEDSLRQGQTLRLRTSLATINQEDKLERPLARRLYGKRLRASVSRLEQFARCPFGHFARYALKLRERPAYQLTSPDMGEFFHSMLRDFALYLQESSLDWGKLSKEESWALINELADRLAPSLQHEILLSNARYRYLTNKLKRTVHHAVRVLGEHARKGLFIPIQLEVGFGPQETLPGIEVPLLEGDSLILSGQIDRVDAALLDDQIYLRILDYKSRELSLPLDTIYYGLNLQLLTYLTVALQGAEVLLNTTPALSGDYILQQKIPAGFLYFPVLEPQLEEQSPLSSEELEQRRVKAVKVKGFLLANPKVLEAMDSTFSLGQSDLLGVRLKKDGSFQKGANVLTEDQFSLLGSYLHQWFKQKGEEILNGDISLSPYRRGKRTGCQYCDYKPVCHFDPYLPENRYRDLPALKPEDVWARMEKTNHTHESNLNWLGEEPGKAVTSDE